MSELEKYRPTMDSDVLHSWAKDAQAEIERLQGEIESLKRDRLRSIELFEELQQRIAELESDGGAAAWLLEWFTADKYHKPKVPRWIEKARKHYQETLAENNQLQQRVKELENNSPVEIRNRRTRNER